MVWLTSRVRSCGHPDTEAQTSGHGRAEARAGLGTRGIATGGVRRQLLDVDTSAETLALGSDDHAFIASLASGDVNVWAGPIFLQDDSEYVPAGSVATDDQIWYLPQLLQGMIGPSE